VQWSVMRVTIAVVALIASLLALSRSTIRIIKHQPTSGKGISEPLRMHTALTTS
jgi:hypothetical protein